MCPFYEKWSCKYGDKRRQIHGRPEGSQTHSETLQNKAATSTQCQKQNDINNDKYQIPKIECKMTIVQTNSKTYCMRITKDKIF